MSPTRPRRRARGYAGGAPGQPGLAGRPPRPRPRPSSRGSHPTTGSPISPGATWSSRRSWRTRSQAEVLAAAGRTPSGCAAVVVEHLDAADHRPGPVGDPPADFLGCTSSHPVERMRLVEWSAVRRTSPDARGRRGLRPTPRKVPVVVRDGAASPAACSARCSSRPSPSSTKASTRSPSSAPRCSPASRRRRWRCSTRSRSP